MNAEYQAHDRRPIASRQRPIWQKIAAAMARSGVSPNAISIAGMIAGILAGAALFMTSHFEDASAGRRLLWLIAAALVQVRLVCNMLDGMVALAAEKASPVGELYNEVPDRISDSAALIGLGYATGGNVELGYLAALLAVLTAYIRAQGKSAGAPSDFSGPMAKPHRMFVVTLVALWLALTPLSWQQWRPPAAALLVIVLGSIVTCLRRLRHIALALRCGGSA